MCRVLARCPSLILTSLTCRGQSGGDGGWGPVELVGQDGEDRPEVWGRASQRKLLQH